ncbi:MAG: YihY/virulence factor BrkB family protein, partial [Acaryochloridaceae cyanobacterium RL_2_7]|nr:YihY/virulence factor BrkB family protein [Acaryochloridaceae cyanobacterium RL_2_7]
MQSEILLQIQEFIGEDGASLVQTTLENAQINGSQGSLTASTVSIGLLFVGATGVFVQLQDALNTIWNVKAHASQGWLVFLRTRLLSFSMVVGIGFLLLVSLVM